MDQDKISAYAILDEILALRIDEGLSPWEIIKLGFDPALVHRIESLYTRTEYKRAQLVQIIKINKKTFGKGRKILVLKRSSTKILISRNYSSAMAINVNREA